MSKTEQNHLVNTYMELLNQQQFDDSKLDYAVFERHKPMLQALANIGNSGVSVFDLNRKEHLFYSPNFGLLLGFNFALLQEKGSDFWDSKIYPQDYQSLTENGISLLKLFYQFSIDEKLNYKLINEFRMMNSEGHYVRIIEQHQALELDDKGNIWLALSIFDLSPNQDISEKFKSVLHNFRTGSIIPFRDEKKGAENIGISLTKREVQILGMVKKGLLSKEISDTLNISLHTVNTHRQRVLEKLGVDNSMEAVLYASRLGLV